MKKEKYRLSRWRFTLGYLVFFVMVFFAIWFFDSGTDTLSYFLTGLAVVLLIFLEVMIRSELLTLDDDHLTYREGILSTKTKKIPFRAVLDTNVHQNVWQRLFHYGTLDIDTGGTADIEVVAKSITKPFHAQRVIQERGQLYHQRYQRDDRSYQKKFRGEQSDQQKNYAQQQQNYPRR